MNFYLFGLKQEYKYKEDRFHIINRSLPLAMRLFMSGWIFLLKNTQTEDNRMHLTKQ